MLNQHIDEKKDERSKKKRTETEIKHTCGFELGSMEKLLPAEIILDIFSRLPAKSVLQCRQVCKKWRNILFVNDTNFAGTHLRRQLHQLHEYHSNSNSAAAAAPAKVGLPFLISGINQLYYGEYDDNDEKYPYKILTRINHPSINMISFAGSCNGLLCLSLHHDDIGDPIYICNPITNEYVNLPCISNENRRISRIMYGFGYHPSTNEYKVVRIYFLQSQDTGQVQVYTLGSGSGWRNRGEVSTYSDQQWARLRLPSRGTLANGAIHWLLHKELKILAFDLADEEFHVVPSPPCCRPPGYSKHSSFILRQLGRCLCVIHQVAGERVEIWSLKKTTNNTTTYNMKEPEYLSWTWSREFSIPWIGQYENKFNPFALTKRGTVLLGFNYERSLSLYDPNTAKLQTLFDDDTGLEHFCNIHPHVNSFVSLKSLGEVVGEEKDIFAKTIRLGKVVQSSKDFKTN
ncbi:F-box domain [Macleaya cordata]|uniref:F-box domain n=1 Tax=Macleaya cordata TaxID=56857 RepID=A0A200QFR2_MACCD|nr:F-box domain [Macleaya cordata]